MSFGLSSGAIGLIGAGASVLGGAMGANAAGQAADAQLQGAREANDTQRYMYDTTRADNAPFRDAGLTANNKLAYMLGLMPSGGASFGSPAKTEADWRAELLPQFTKQAAATGPTEADALNFMNYGIPMPAYGQSSGPTIDEAGLAAAIQARMAQQSAQQSQQAQAAAGDPAFGSLLKRFSTADLNADPVYQTSLQFGLDEGTKALNHQAAAGGGLLSGATAKALARYATDYAGTKANESYNRFNTDQTNTYNRLAGMSGAGQTATAQVGAAGQTYANNVSANQIGAGNARASSAIAGANALSGGMTNAFNTYQQNQLMNKLFPSFQPNAFGTGMSPYGGFNAAANGGWGIE